MTRPQPEPDDGGSGGYFSDVAARYQRYRPTYPKALFHWLASLVPASAQVWDCACGSGQATAGLASISSTLVASDISRSQIAQAPELSGTWYLTASAERPPFREDSFDLVTVAQAAHWLDLARFQDAVRRVLRRGGVLTLWSYGLMSVTPEVDRVVGELHRHELGPYWPTARSMVDRGYQGLSLAHCFAKITPPAPALSLAASWSLDHVLGYIRTWSGYRRHSRATGEEALSDYGPLLREAWGSADARLVTWPLAILAGRLEPSA